MERLSLLRKYVPTRTASKIDRLLKNIEDISQNSLIQKRDISILFASKREYEVKEYGAYTQTILSKEAEIKDPYLIFSPLQVQTFSYLLEFLHDNLNELLKNIGRLTELLSFKYLSWVGIPAIFGFFSNSDHCYNASNFYIKASLSLNPNDFTELCSVFFSIDCVNTFSKLLFEHIFVHKYLKNQSIEELEENIFDYSAKLLIYLPETHLSIIRQIQTKWDKNEVWRFLVFALILPQFKIQYLTSPYSHKKIKNKFNIKAFVDKINSTTNENKIKIYINEELISHSLLELPPQTIKVGELFSQKTILTLFDVKAFFTLPIIFPAHLQCISDFILNTKVDQTVPFYVKYFIDRSVPEDSIFLFPQLSSNIMSFSKSEEFDMKDTNDKERELSRRWALLKKELSDPVAFLLNIDTNKDEISHHNRYIKAFQGEDGKELKQTAVNKEIERFEKAQYHFEKLLLYKQNFDIVSQWDQRTNEYLNMVSHYFALTLIKENKPEPVRAGTVVFWKYIILLSMHEKELCADYSKQLKKLEKSFKKLLQSLKNEFTNGLSIKIPISLKYFLYDLTGLLSILNNEASMFDRYCIISSFISKANQFAPSLVSGDQDDEGCKFEKISYLLHFCIVIYDAIWVLRAAVFFNKHVFGSKHSQICPFDEAENWNQFFTSLLNLLSRDPELLKNFTSLVTS